MFLETEKQKRWCQHLHEVCGTKQIWKILAFTCILHPRTLHEVLRLSRQDRDAEEEPHHVVQMKQQQRHRVLRERAEDRWANREAHPYKRRSPRISEFCTPPGFEHCLALSDKA